ncbi:MAG: hypothetical protein CVT69_02090 [Actinobacteria bacterium HGW-Actinobacteria-9]|jgi:radical SAM-linked protein|nr:MAG: hypothetical protein CVT69_02090 [Actinobacteria bacterium HGW-Actinobacteria-9]
MPGSASTSCSGVSGVAPGEFRCRIGYAKRDRLRFLSHLEVGHAIERGIRRAGLPYGVTHGFSPHMKIAFGPALPVGTAGLQEYFDVWLTTYLPAEEVLSRFSSAMPEGLSPFAVAYVGAKESSLTASCTMGEYEVEVTGEVDAGTQLRQALEDLLAGKELTVEHKGKTKVFDLTSSLPKGAEVRSSKGGVTVEVTVRMGPEGSLRPESLVREALASSGSTGAVTFVTRRALLIEHDDGVRRPI